MIGADIVAKATADGYTVLTAAPAEIVILPHLQKMPYTARGRVVVPYAPGCFRETRPAGVGRWRGFPRGYLPGFARLSMSRIPYDARPVGPPVGVLCRRGHGDDVHAVIVADRGEQPWMNSPRFNGKYDGPIVIGSSWMKREARMRTGRGS